MENNLHESSQILKQTGSSGLESYAINKDEYNGD
jgi:hypothetical protein